MSAPTSLYPRVVWQSCEFDPKEYHQQRLVQSTAHVFRMEKWARMIDSAIGEPQGYWSEIKEAITTEMRPFLYSLERRGLFPLPLGDGGTTKGDSA